MKANKSVRNVVREWKSKNELPRRILDRLKTANEMCWKTNECAVTVTQPTKNQGGNERLKKLT
jgi:hypothetical protein